jgi:glucosylceramidase
MQFRRIFFFLSAVVLLFIQSNCSKKTASNTGGGGVTPPVTPPTNDISFWATKANQSVLLQKQNNLLALGSAGASPQTLEIDSTQAFQTIDGFGYTLTGGSATLINKMDAGTKATLLNELFGNGPNDIGVSYLRVSLGASDLSAAVFSYDDMPAGQTDITLANFSLSQDTVDLIPVLKQILAINPSIKIMASPWSPPVWMKDNANAAGGSLQPQYYNVYAQYFVKYVQQMKAKGIAIDAVTIQNEPQNAGNNPSMLMSALQQADFIKNNLGPVFQAAGITAKIIIWDHNCDNANYPITILNDAAAKQYINGAAFHLYGGDISALSAVHSSHPDKNLYFTEQWTSGAGSFDGDFKWHLKNVIIGSMRNWSKVALEWNLASDPAYNPHTPGGCTQCKGALTINGSFVTKNVGYYIVGQISKFVTPGSYRINSTDISGIYNVAFLRPDGKKVLIALNDGTADITFNIKFNGKVNTTVLPAGTAGTYIW